MKYIIGAINVLISIIITYLIVVFCANYPLLFILFFMVSMLMNVYFYKKYVRGSKNEKTT